MIQKFLSLILLSCICSGVNAQRNNDYRSAWKKVEEFEKKGLTSSALKEVRSIFNQALKIKNETQQIKSAIYQIRYRNMIEQDDLEKNIYYIDTLIAKAKSPAKNILQSVQAELYWNYQQNNRYRLYDRTNTVNDKSGDLTTWSIEKINETISRLYSLSLYNESLLKLNSLKNYEPILEKGKNTEKLRPTLFDFLAHRALNYFTNGEKDVLQPSYKFILNNEMAFAPASDFVKYQFQTKDTLASYYKALKLFQNILKFHLSDKSPEALIDADLLRLSFANVHGIFTNKNSLYESALKSIEDNYSNNPAATQAMYLRAALYNEQGELFDFSKESKFQFHKKKAKELCDSVINRYPKTEGAINSENLSSQIVRPNLHLQTEKVNVPQLPFRSLVRYKNVDRLYLKVVKVNREQLKSFEADYDSSWKKIAKLDPVKEYQLSLPTVQDYQEHSTEIKIDALPIGTYIILASLNSNYGSIDNILAKQITYVSSISYIIKNTNELYVLDRNSGKPLSGASIQTWTAKYNSISRKNEQVKDAILTTDKNGYARFVKGNNNFPNTILQVNYKNDELFTDDSHYNYDYNNAEFALRNRTFLFTDRSIYRPGQPIFFKGIAVQNDSSSSNSKVNGGYKTTIILSDANGQKIGAVKVTANEYGSFNGNFILPTGGNLNGQFSITDSSNQSSQFINVEEYKRPKFLVDITKPVGTFRINDSITVRGNAKAFSGNNVDGAKITYRVTRQARYPIWQANPSYSKSWPPYVRGEAMEITNGITVTALNGEFIIKFKAIPDETIEKKDQPIFSYEVSADVTDMNGETRSSSSFVDVGYQALMLNIDIDPVMDADSLRKLKINSTNFNGSFEQSKVKVTIEKLTSPDRLYRNRFWDKPDMFLLTQKEYHTFFPHDIYKNEDEIAHWKVEKLIAEFSDTTSTKSDIKLTSLNFQQGWYRITAFTLDRFGEAVKTEKFLKLIETGKTTGNDKINFSIDTKIAEPGKKINYSVSTDYDTLFVIRSIIKTNDRESTSFFSLNKNNSFKDHIEINEIDRGGLQINYAFVQNNRFYNGTESISIPWNNKELNISYETFRDKLLPGSQEKWKIKITGQKAEKVTAEALISMYDASLDQFKMHNWNNLKELWPNLSSQTYWSTTNFAALDATILNNKPYEMAFSISEKAYDQLLSFLPEARISYEMGYATQKVMASDEVRHTKLAKPEANQAGDSTGQSKAPLKNSDTPFQSRKDFKETAFFFPALTTNTNGNIEFSFTMPEALTTWKLLTLTHTKDLSSGYSENKVITQKPLMVQPNAPRFLREGDKMEFSAKIVNLSNTEVTGTAQLELFDASTNKSVDGWLKNIFPNQFFTAPANQSVAIKFPIDIPFTFNSALSYRIKVISNDSKFSDGEESIIPVLTNRMLVTESYPLNLRAKTASSFKFDKLLKSNESGTLSNHALTVEYTSNPIWYVVQALPYLAEIQNECSEQSFNKFYANILAAKIAGSMPKLKTIFDSWRTEDTSALISNLLKNEELKSVLLEETPWILAASSESEQKKNIGILFNISRINKEKQHDIDKLTNLQLPDGAFPWFNGGRDDRFITQYILSGIGRLKRLNSLNADDITALKPVIDKAFKYVDEQIIKEFYELKKRKANLNNNNLSSLAIQYLYMRSFFTEIKVTRKAEEAYRYFEKQSKKFWLKNNKYMQSMIALSLYRSKDSKTAKEIIRSLKENAIFNEESGMYFNDYNKIGYYWQQAPIESHSLIIEAFAEIENNPVINNDLKTWLLKQKQTQNWRTTKATADACYALLITGDDWITEEKEVNITLGKVVISNNENKIEAGTGYLKKRIPADQIKPEMGNISISVTGNSKAPSTSWGAVYWQYFEDVDKISASETPLKLSKKIFIERNSDRGPVLKEVLEGDQLNIGDKIKVRINLKADRDMQYVHMKDMRAGALEPTNVISGYKWQGGLGYYESTKDASTNFFFDWLPRGSYVFEYSLYVTHVGNFSNGIATIQCMYAPEFMSHSKGIRIDVE